MLFFVTKARKKEIEPTTVAFTVHAHLRLFLFIISYLIYFIIIEIIIIKCILILEDGASRTRTRSGVRIVGAGVGRRRHQRGGRWGQPPRQPSGTFPC